MKKVTFYINKKIHEPFYQADPSLAQEIFYHEEYMSVWDEAREMGLIITIPERIQLLEQLESVWSVQSKGTHYFFNNDFDAYWEELAQLLEGKL